MIASLPIGYILFKIGCPAYSVFLVILAIEVVGMFAIWWLIHTYEYFPYRQLFTKVLVPCGLVTLLTLLLPTYILYFLEDDWLRFCLILLASEISLSLSALYIGLSKDERTRVFSFVNSKLKHNSNVN